VQELLTLSGHQWGPAHTEIKLSDGIVYIIETQLRFGGDYIWEMTWQVSGFDLVKETFASLVNTPTPVREPQYKCMSISFLFKKLTRSQVYDLLDKHNLSACLIRCQIDECEEHKIITHSGQRAGYVLFKFESNKVPDSWETFNNELGH